MLEAPILPANPPVIALPKQGWKDNILINLNTRLENFQATMLSDVQYLKSIKSSRNRVLIYKILKKKFDTLKSLKCFSASHKLYKTLSISSFS